jgi:peroxiredoxin
MSKHAPSVPPPVGKQRPRNETTRFVLFGTAAIVAIVALVVGVLLATRSPSPVAPPEQPVASDRNAPESLIQAANAVGFHPTTEPGVGLIEGRPASAAQPAFNPNLLPVGTLAPSFTLRTPQGQSVSLADYRGKALLLEFFATWCPHCNAEAPHLRKLYATLPKASYGFVSVNADGETAPSVFSFHRYYGLPYPALVDPSSTPGSFASQGAAGPVTSEYRVASYPTFYVIDPQGRILWRSDGEQPDALLRQELTLASAHG